MYSMKDYKFTITNIDTNEIANIGSAFKTYNAMFGNLNLNNYRKITKSTN